MTKNKGSHLIAIILLLLGMANGRLVQSQKLNQSSFLEPDLQRALEEAAPDESLRVILHLRGVENGDRRLENGGTDDVVSALQATAARSQAPLRAHLDEAQAAGLVDSYTPFWIVNAIAVRAHPAAIHELATRPDVAAIHLDHYRRWLPPNTKKPGFSEKPGFSIKNLVSSSVEWNVSRVRADEVWSALHISGTGTIVAGVDTGVDWLHPALQSSYRGYNPHGPSNHTYNWYDATDGGALYPVDGNGHGSHTLGTIVGQDGIGVAPGARWIGVRVLNSEGYGYDSWIHAGFQWLLAPGGDPARAPDVINCSWGNSNGALTTFQTDLQALRAAGIFAVFANGNSGPNKGTVGSPASLPEAFAVGALDDAPLGEEEVASFSSRGPSPWSEIRPHVSAPGVNVRSSMPGGVYSEKNGTSMAAPHVAGIAALLRSVMPTISITHTAYLITNTAVPLGKTIPNNDTGWGRVDAFAAVSALARSGIISGTVRQASNPIAGAKITASPHGGGSSYSVTSDDDGRYLLALAPDVYDLTASAFGYEPATAWGISALTDTTTLQNFSLAPLPTGELRVRLFTEAGQPLTATIAVLDTPLETTGESHTFELPAGDYTVRASRLGYRVVTGTASVTVGEMTTLDLELEAAPSILLIDSGRWYYDSEISYFRQALDDLAYVYDDWAVRHLNTDEESDAPTASDLTPYDIVIWSAPRDAPGFIDAQGAVIGYLSAGGKLLLSGQDVAYWDGGGALGFWSAYYEDYLKSRYVSDNAPTRVLSGLEGDIFAGLTITITGAGGADNQDYPDVIAVVDADAAAPVLTYRDGGPSTSAGVGGVRVSTCLDYAEQGNPKALNLSFGFEAINERGTRREFMGRAIDWLTAPPPTVGLELDPASQLRIGPPGSLVTHTLRLRHVGQAGSIDAVSLSLEGVSWPTQLSTPELQIAPCTSATVVVSVTIPATATWDVADVIILTAQSALSPALTLSATLTSKAPASILLVDDDRWYEQQEKYEAAMAGAGLAYDFWQIKPALGGGRDRSPSLATLEQYPILVWWTGYDWYAPVTTDEEETLSAYLDGGGRLFLSAQDFLYYHHDDPFSLEYLGVLSYTEDVTPTQAVGVPEDAIGDRLGPWTLSYPRGYQNWSDGVTPAPGVSVTFRDQGRHAIALGHRRAEVRDNSAPSPLGERVGVRGNYATLFFAFPFEALPETVRPTVMEQAVGWLSWLGGSTFTADQGAIASGEKITYTLRVQNDGLEAVSAAISNTLPPSITLISGTLSGPGSYVTSTRRLSWSGALDPGAVVSFTYRAVVTSSSTGPIINPAELTLEDHQISFRREAVVRPDAPDLGPSAFDCAPSLARPGARVSCTLALENDGPAGALTATAVISLPVDGSLVPGSLDWTVGAAERLTDGIRWAGPLGAGARVTLTYQLDLPVDPTHRPLYSVAFLEDGAGGAWERANWVALDPSRVYLPMVMRNR